jgi:FkbM family methyltransferase
MFNNSDPASNGEKQFFLSIKDKIKIIFDVGCNTETEFLQFQGDVHYFDPNQEFIERLKQKQNQNRACYFNPFGLGAENCQKPYYPSFESFYNRVASTGRDDDANKRFCTILKGVDYVHAHQLKQIDFLKIDTEGYEWNVMKGFEYFLSNVQILQFEYGGTYLDNNIHLIDVIRYLEEKGFHKFSYLTNKGPVLIPDFKDHYQYCNIVCLNKSSEFQPF